MVIPPHISQIFIKRSLSYRKPLSRKSFSEIEEALVSAHEGHNGRIHIFIESRRPVYRSLRGESSRSRALNIFSLERVWDTEHNNGVLLYVLLSEQTVEIVADRGLNVGVTKSEWEQVCSNLVTDISENRLIEGTVYALKKVGDLLRNGTRRPKPREETLCTS